MKIDPITSEVLWKTPLDSTVFQDFRSYVTSFVTSHVGDGYIWVGSAPESPDGGARSLIYGKLSKDGDMLWRREIFDPFLPSSMVSIVS